MRSRFLVLLLTLLPLFLGACVTHIKPTVVQNPPPTEKFAAFNHFELSKIVLPPPYAGQAPNERALIKIQDNVSLKMIPAVAGWNAAGASATPVRTLLIEPTITEIKFISVGSRLIGGPLPGSSAVIMRVRITDKETGAVIAYPEFYARANAFGGHWSVGTTDNLMLLRVADRISDYLLANYGVAVGGPSGADPKKT